MFKLTIKTGGSAFRDESRVDRNGDYMLDRSGAEVKRLMTYVAGCIEAGIDSGVLMDMNGNKVGEWIYE